MDGLWQESRVQPGMLLGTCRRCLVSFQRSSAGQRELPLRQIGVPQLTCWLMRTMPMSFRSFVYLLKASSMVARSVLWSQTRKLRWESGGSVTWPTPARSRPVTELFCVGSASHRFWDAMRSAAFHLLLVPNHCQKLPVLQALVKCCSVLSKYVPTL